MKVHIFSDISFDIHLIICGLPLVLKGIEISFVLAVEDLFSLNGRIC